MDKIANKVCRLYVENRREFDGSNLFARNIGKLYIVYSYGTHYPMFLFRKGWWYENSDKYSNSTSRQHSQARPNYSRNVKELTTVEMKNIIHREAYGK